MILFCWEINIFVRAGCRSITGQYRNQDLVTVQKGIRSGILRAGNGKKGHMTEQEVKSQYLTEIRNCTNIQELFELWQRKEKGTIEFTYANKVISVC